MTDNPELPATGRRDGRDAYHHGKLREALIQATGEILSERGAEGFSLREAARRAGVSAGAPAHHFGSAAGLLTEVAIAGFEELTQILRKVARTEAAPGARLRAQGFGYVQFALAHPGRFQLMFRHDLLVDEERLHIAGKAARAEIEASILAYLEEGGGTPDERTMRATLLAAWSTAHGFAHLALDGKLATMADMCPLDDFVSEVLPDVLMAAMPDRKF